jgi:hypothetical protein
LRRLEIDRRRIGPVLAVTTGEPEPRKKRDGRDAPSDLQPIS